MPLCKMNPGGADEARNRAQHGATFAGPEMQTEPTASRGAAAHSSLRQQELR